MTIFGLWVCVSLVSQTKRQRNHFQVINKAGGLVYQRNFAGYCFRICSVISDSIRYSDGLAPLTSNEYLVLAGTLHGIHAITSRLSPTGPSSGVQVIEGETFKMNVLLTPTGKTASQRQHTSQEVYQGRNSFCSPHSEKRLQIPFSRKCTTYILTPS